jgi:RNA polymerase sigma factor (sigma-70 family)
LELLDLIQEASIGLLTAAERFEAGYGSFTTFAMPWIRQKLDRALVGQGRVLRIPMHVQEKLERLRLEEEWYLAAKGRPPTPEELAAELGIDLDGLAKLRSAEREVVPLDQTVPGDEDESFYEELIEDPEGTAFAQGVEDRQWLAWIVDGLDYRSLRILTERFSLGLTNNEIGARVGLTGERVRQIARDALEKLRRRRSLP